MADFQQAVQWMKEGKKVRSDNWCLWLDDVDFVIDEIINDKLANIETKGITLPYVQATDWEIYKEEATEARKKAEEQYFDSDWNLSHYRMFMDHPYARSDNFMYFEEDIKTFIQKVKEDLNKEYGDYMNMPMMLEIIDKRVGDLK